MVSGQGDGAFGCRFSTWGSCPNPPHRSYGTGHYAGYIRTLELEATPERALEATAGHSIKLFTGKFRTDKKLWYFIQVSINW